jgi:hypothetical protein
MAAALRRCSCSTMTSGSAHTHATEASPRRRRTTHPDVMARAGSGDLPGSSSSGGRPPGNGGSGGGPGAGGIPRRSKPERKARKPGLFEIKVMSPPPRSLGIFALPPNTHNGEEVRPPCALRMVPPHYFASSRSSRPLYDTACPLTGCPAPTPLLNAITSSAASASVHRLRLMARATLSHHSCSSTRCVGCCDIITFVTSLHCALYGSVLLFFIQVIAFWIMLPPQMACLFAVAQGTVCP